MRLINELCPKCVECKEAICHPLCSSCLSKEITAWLYNKDEGIKKIVAKEIEEILYRSRLFNSEVCAICSNKKVFLCPSCFTERIYNRLKTEGVKKSILAEFLTLFNFDFEHTHLTKEAENLGII